MDVDGRTGTERSESGGRTKWQGGDGMNWEATSERVVSEERTSERSG